jgi:hypothetical protein
MTKDDFLRLQNIIYIYIYIYICIESTKRVVGAYIKTRQFLFNHGYVFTLMMSFISKMQVR